MHLRGGRFESCSLNALPERFHPWFSLSVLQAFTPQAAFLQGRQCDLQLSVNLTDQTPGVPVDTSLIESSTPISIQGTGIIGVDGEPVVLRALNCFGFDVRVRPFMILDV